MKDITYSHGAQLMDDATVRFRLWAPGSTKVTVHVGQDALPMQALPEGWFELCHRCAAGTPYCFEPEGLGKLPDPASRLQLNDVEGPSVVVDHRSYEWRNEHWQGRPWHEAVFYEAHVGLLGGFEGVRQRLPELRELGITALELMPVADFSGPRNWGYDGVLPYAPDTAYGTPDELKALIDAAHGMGIMVFLDVVYNHFGPVGNYLADYAPQFFREDRQTPWGAAIDFRRGPVRSFFADNALYWLKEFRFDGLRFDAVHAIVDKEDWLGELAVQLRAALPIGRCVHLVLENDDNTASLLRHGYDAQWNDDMHHVVHHLLTGESHGYYAAYAERATEKLARGLAQGFIYQGEPSPAHEGRPRGELSSMLPPTSFIFFLQNHDQVGNRARGERLTTLCRERPGALKAAIALQLLCPQIPLIFMGEELGSDTPFLYFTSFSDPEFAAKVAEGRRAEFAAFHEGDPESIPDPNALSTWDTSRLDVGDDPSAPEWSRYYRELLALRRHYLWPGLRDSSCEEVQVIQEACLAARWRLGNGARLTLMCNLSERSAAVLPMSLEAGDTVFHESVQGATASVKAGVLPACCTVAAIQVVARVQNEADRREAA